MKRFTAVLFTAILLAGCGGGGGGGGSSRSPTMETPPPSQPPPTFTDSEIIPSLNSIIQRSDSLILSDLAGKFRGETYAAPTSCTRMSCTTDLGYGYTSSSDLRDVRDLGLDTALRYSAVGEENGVRIAQVDGRSTFLGFPADYRGYGAWLDDSAFSVTLATIRNGRLEGVNLAGLEVGYGISIGNDTGTRPTGNATWRGIMVGGTDINGPVQSIRGNATLTYDVGRNDLDVAFTNNRIVDTGSRFQDMRWSNLSVDSTGSFKQETPQRDIEGRFYGPNHAEVGGVFVHPEAIGAFGAQK